MKSPSNWGLVDWLQHSAADGLVILRATTTPSPSHRPRVGRWGTYYPRAYQDYHADCVEQFAKQKGNTALSGRLGAVVETIVKRPKKTKLLAPKGDSDNYAKAPLDAATKAGVWGDDAQVVPVASTRRFTEPGELPGVILYIARLDDGETE